MLNVSEKRTKQEKKNIGKIKQECEESGTIAKSKLTSKSELTALDVALDVASASA